jgi:hypothetical protein
VRDRFSHLIRDRMVDHADPGNQLPWEEGVHQEFGKTPAAAIIVFDRVPDARQQTILTRCRRVYVGAQELGFVSHLFQINTKESFLCIAACRMAVDNSRVPACQAGRQSFKPTPY